MYMCTDSLVIITLFENPFLPVTIKIHNMHNTRHAHYATASARNTWYLSDNFSAGIHEYVVLVEMTFLYRCGKKKQ